jgi:hypothetical protein
MQRKLHYLLNEYAARLATDSALGNKLGSDPYSR